MTEKEVAKMRLALSCCAESWHLCDRKCPAYDLDFCRQKLIEFAAKYIDGQEKAIRNLKEKLKDNGGENDG